MHPNLLFNNIGLTESTNNYAMEQIHAGLAKHGMAWFSDNQTMGKGQRGKSWESQPGMNIALSVVFEPVIPLFQHPFLFNMLISLTCRQFLQELIKEKVDIKWPNDLFIRDRKAVGLLIENKYRGNTWNWSIVGIGINVNQTSFAESLKNAISLRQISGETYHPEFLATKLHDYLLSEMNNIAEKGTEKILFDYNQHLYKIGEKVTLKKDDSTFDATIKGVNERGQLITRDIVERVFQFGEVEWVKAVE